MYFLIHISICDKVEMTGDLLLEISRSIIAMDEVAAPDLCREALLNGIPAETILITGLMQAMDTVGQKYENGEYFVPELLLCSDAFNAGLEVLQPHLEHAGRRNVGHIVLGVIFGDTHDIGKNVVKAMFRGAGFTVTDLGRNVAYEEFVRTAVETNADIIGMSSLMTTAMEGMAEVIRMLEQCDLRERFRVIIGGAATSPAFARSIGADACANSAASAVKLIRLLTPGGGPSWPD